MGCAWLACIWATAAIGIWTVRALTPKADDVLAMLRANTLASLPAQERDVFLGELANALNRLDAKQRRVVQLSDEIRAIYPRMSPAERLRFLERTRPPGSEQMARAFSRLSVERRRRFVNEAVEDIDALRPDNRTRMLRDGTRDRLERAIRQGLPDKPDDSPQADSLDVQPFVEQTQRVLQGVN